MKYPILLFFSVLMVNTGCKQKIESSLSAWNTITITSEGRTVITIHNTDDTSIVNRYHVGSFFSPLPKNAKVKVDTMKAYFTIAEKDTIFLLAKALILNPAKTPKKCTEFVGHLELDVDYGQFRQYCEYTSVCNWNMLSDTTKHLHDILKRKIKNVYLGENDIH